MADSMKMIDLTNFELFESFIEITIDDSYVDLHNDFDCYSITLANGQLSISFKPSSNTSGNIRYVDLFFKNVEVKLLNFKIGKENLNNLTADNFYRGRFDNQEGGLSEITADEKYYYYLDFYEDLSIELLASSVIAELK